MMKNFLCICVSLCVLLCLVGCGEKKTVDSNEESVISNELSEEDKYNKAFSYIKSKEYDNAIEILEEIPNYKDSKSLVGKVHYVYGSQLFNERDFSGAYQHFQEASGYSDIAERKSMVDYYGGINFTNNGQYSSACTYFKRAIDSDYVQDAVKHVSELTKNLLSGGWIGSCVVNGNTFQVQMSYSKSSNNFSLVWADRSNGGYKHVTDMDYGTLSVVGSRNAFYYEGNFYTVEFDFYSSTSVRAKWSDSKLDGMAGGMFKRDYAAVFEYKIPDVVYPIMTIPDLFSNNSSNVVDSSSQAEPEVSSINTTSTTSQTNNSNNKSPSNLKSGKSNNSSNTTQKSKPNNASSTLSQSTKPNSTSSTVSQGKKPNTPSTEQHVHDFSINATCEEPAKCQCGQTSGIANGHLWVAATCTTPKKCKVCNKTEGQALGHIYKTDATLICDGCRELNPNGDTIISKLAVVNNSDLFIVASYSISNYGKQSYVYDLGYQFYVDFKITLNEEIMRDNVTLIAYDEKGNKLYESGFGFTPSSSGHKGDTISKQARFYIDGYKPVAKVVIE